MLAVAEATQDLEAEAEYAAWLDSGAAGEMQYLHTHSAAKYRPEKMLAGCSSILLVGLGYYQKPPNEEGTPTGTVARYAWGRDYHKALGKPLRRIARSLEERYSGHRFRAFTDATPLSERHYGARAGLGFRGRNTLLIHETLGSWFFIGEVLSTLAVEPSEPAPSARRSCPHGCRACIAACPTGALSGPYRFDARLCISYLTIEHKGVIPRELAQKMGTQVFGCDRCQEVCPLNRGVSPTTVSGFTSHIAGPEIPLELLLALRNDDEVRARFAGSPLLRAKRRGLVRNGVIAAANLLAGYGSAGAAPRPRMQAAPDPELGTALRAKLESMLRSLATDEDSVVAAQAAQALQRSR